MRFEILELVEQYQGPVCPACVSESTGASLAEMEIAVRASEQLEFVVGNCGRCHKPSTNLIAAKPTLASRLKEIAGTAVKMGSFGPFGLLGWAGATVLSPRGRRWMAGAYDKLQEALTPSEPNVQNAPQPIPEPIASPVQSQLHILSPATAEGLDATRRSLIKKLNMIDSEHRRDEPLGKRIQRLRTSGKLPPDVANAMRQITNLRNRAVYDEYVLVAEDKERLRAACTCLENWSQGKTRVFSD